jgi:orotate phosphoribosyltransferase
MELGSIPISTVVAEYSADQEFQYHHFIIRKTPKGHGVTSQILFYEKPKKPVVIVDDVLTTGGSLYKAYNILIANQIDVAGCVCVMDREELNTTLPPVPTHSLFKKSDII